MYGSLDYSISHSCVLQTNIDWHPSKVSLPVLLWQWMTNVDNVDWDVVEIHSHLYVAMSESLLVGLIDCVDDHRYNCYENYRCICNYNNGRIQNNNNKYNHQK